jgi:alkanesulfonate monooxygenase SsuD/methylene tetrahydromethanopterin reductase-like flavin-dependent oxidoreductase (luciferase family)
VLVGSWTLGMPGSPATFYARLAATVEQSRYDMLFVGDHLFAAGPSVDSLTLAASLAARTERVLIGTGVLQLALREPVATAKQIATIDCLSDGRFVLGVGVGGEFADEWNAAGVPRERRGERLDECLALARSLWSGRPVAHRGPFREVSGVVGSPLPGNPGGPPIWVGGRSDAALRRAARHDGWLAYASSPHRIRATILKLDDLRPREASAFRIGAVVFTNVAGASQQARRNAAQILGKRYGQDFDRFIDAFCAVGSPDAVLERLAEFRAAGVDDLFICPQCPAEEFLDQVEAAEALF